MSRVTTALFLIATVSAIATGFVLSMRQTSAAFDFEFTVDSTGDTADASPDGVCDDGTGACTLRAAIDEANSAEGTSLISFAIPGDGLHTITPQSAELPPLLNNVTLNGYTQPGISLNSRQPGEGTDAVLKIEIDGSALGAAANGITMIGTSSVVKGLVIKNFGGSGVRLLGADANTVAGNFIGTDATGTAAAGNSVGVTVDDSNDNTIGTTAAPDTNIISGNGTGILLTGNSEMNLVRRNVIGAQADGVSPLPNTSHGIQMTGGADCNTIGGVPTAYRNIIAFNGGDGVSLSTDGGINNYVDPNYIHDNGGLGVDINDDGPTPNDPQDVDTGPNDLQNYPVLTSAVAGAGGITITGVLNSTPGLYFNMFFLVNDACDPSGYGEGQMFVDEATVLDTEGDGNIPFTLFFDGPIEPGKFIAAASSNPESSSEYSLCIQVENGEPGTSTPTPSGSPTPTPTATPIGQTPTPTPTGGTPTPTATPTPPAGPLHGDVRCDGGVDATDALGILREVAGMPQIAQTEPCPDLGDNVDGRIFGDVLCNGGIDAVDALAVLRFVAELPPISGGPGCPVVGEFVSEPQPVSGTVDVTMGDNFFELNGIRNPIFRMTADDTVIMNLANQGLAVHNMRTAGADGHFDTEDDRLSDPTIVTASNAATIEISFDHPGTYRYRCDFHPADMHGAIVVD